ncbi:MAG: Type 1 glutamine amidotransferase-like domain-containing protein, partial [Clostridium sp.]
GFRGEHIKLLDYQLTNQEMQKEIKQHSILYFTGGRPEKLMRILAEKELIQEIKEFSGLIVGVSAGALVFCEDCIITKDQYYLETQVIEGLGLVDFSVEVHYNGNNDKELFSLSANRNIYAIPNGSAIFWEDNVVKPIHNVTLFSKRKKQIVTED